MAQLITGIKTPEQLEAMREGGKRLAQIFADIRQFVHAGVSEKQIDAFAAERIAAYGAEPTYKTPEVNFPGVVCISTNEAIVHGVPSDYILQQGDVVSFDLVITYRGMKTDSAFTMVVDDAPTGAIKHLLHTTERSLYAGIDAIKGPVRTGDIGAAVEAVLQKGRLGIIRELVGHGVGLEMHMPPDVPNYGRKGTAAPAWRHHCHRADGYPGWRRYLQRHRWRRLDNLQPRRQPSRPLRAHCPHH